MVNASDQGPYLQAALLCEKVLVERDGVKSAIRIVDRVTQTVIHPNPPSEMAPFDHTLFLLIKMKAGRARGVHSIKIELAKPSGEKTPPIIQNVLFEGEEDRGIDLVSTMNFRFSQTGIYWIHIYLGDRKLTQIPFRVIYMPQVRQIPPGAPGSSPE